MRKEEFDTDLQEDMGTVAEAPEIALKPPSLYQVLLHNDDYTPMEFVVVVLERFFSMDCDKATRVMLEVHTQGKAVCGVYARDVAETIVAHVTEYALEENHPLLCTMENVED